MKSPFPGMDPYIEACGLWQDFHNHLIEGICVCLADSVAEHYHLRAGKRAYLLPMNSQGVDEEHREAFVEIYESSPEQRLVTSLEVLSPTNKRPGTPGWDLYQRKRQSHLLGNVNLVEIDLLRGGQRMPMLDPWPDSPYTVLVARARKPDLCKAWPVHLRDPVPTIPVPLATPDPDVPLNLQPLIETIYRRFRYERSIDYTRPLTPPPSSDESAWLEQLLRPRRERRKRTS